MEKWITMAGGAYADSQMAQLTEQMKQLRETMVKSSGPKSMGGQLKESAAKSPGEFMMQALTRALAPVLKVLDAINKLISMVIMPVTNLLLPFMIPIFTILLPIVRFMNTLLRPVMQNLMTAMKSMAAGGSTDVMTSAFGDAFASIFSQLLPVLMKGLTQILDYVIQIGAAILTGLIKALPSLIQSWLPNLILILTDVFQLVMTLLTALWDGLSGTLLPMINTLFDWAKGAFGGVISTIVNFFTGDLPANVKSLLDMVGKLSDMVVNIVSGFILLATGNIQQFVGTVLNNVQGLIASVVNPLMQVLQNVLDAVYGFLKPIMTQIDSFLTMLYRSFQGFIRDLMFAVADTLDALHIFGDQAAAARASGMNAGSAMDTKITTASDALDAGYSKLTDILSTRLPSSGAGDALISAGADNIKAGGEDMKKASEDFSAIADKMSAAADKMTQAANTMSSAKVLSSLTAGGAAPGIMGSAIQFLNSAQTPTSMAQGGH